MVKTVQINNKEVRYPDILYYLVQNAIERVKNKLDNVIIVTGKVGSGKSNLTMGLAALYEHEMGRAFTLDNIHFLIEDVLRQLYRHDNRTQTILHDEAVSGSSSRDATSNLGKLLFKALITKRYKSHFIILNIDNIKELNKKVIERSVAWIHVSYARTPKGYVKGLFKVFGPKKTEKMYLDIKSGKYLNVESHPIYKNNSYLFKSYKYFDLVMDEKKYEEKKAKDTSFAEEDLGFINIDNPDVKQDLKLVNKWTLTAPILVGLLLDKFKINKSTVAQNLDMNWNDITRITKGVVLDILKHHEKDLLVKQELIDYYKKHKLKLIEDKTKE